MAALVDSFGSRFEFAAADFSDDEALRAVTEKHAFERIVHLGAQAGVRYSIENPGAYLKSNLAGHLNMLELARSRGCSHFVYASSSSVYGRNEKLPFSVEDRVDHPVSLYAATKKADELMSETYAHLYRIPQTGCGSSPSMAPGAAPIWPTGFSPKLCWPANRSRSSARAA
jgi:UDP-glucuronate 4-epimerase